MITCSTMAGNEQLPSGARRLRAWRKKNGLVQSAACTMVGVDHGRYSAYETGRMIPGARVAMRIEVATGGDVPSRTWNAARRARDRKEAA